MEDLTEGPWRSRCERAGRGLEDVCREPAEADPAEERIVDALERLGRRGAGVAVPAEAVGLPADSLGLG